MMGPGGCAQTALTLRLMQVILFGGRSVCVDIAVCRVQTRSGQCPVDLGHFPSGFRPVMWNALQCEANR